MCNCNDAQVVVLNSVHEGMRKADLQKPTTFHSCLRSHDRKAAGHRDGAINLKNKCGGHSLACVRAILCRCRFDFGERGFTKGVGDQGWLSVRRVVGILATSNGVKPAHRLLAWNPFGETRIHFGDSSRELFVPCRVRDFGGVLGFAFKTDLDAV